MLFPLITSGLFDLKCTVVVYRFTFIKKNKKKSQWTLQYTARARVFVLYD